MDKEQVKIFENEEFGQVRVMGTSENPWFVAKDVAIALGYTNPQKAIRDHVDVEDKGVNEMFTPGGKQKVPIINESGVYALIMGSKLERAKKFKRWVTSEVLPSIRRQGYYGNVENTFIKTCSEIVESQKQMANTLVLLAKSQEQQTQVLKMFADYITTTTTKDHNQTKPSLQPYQINKKDTYTASEICSAFGFQSAQQLNNELVRRGIISRDRYNLDITPEYADRGIAILKHFNFRGKEINTYVVWTSQGVEFLKSIL